jgi:glycosyltransferase involved in cell wall biosynthesis
MNHPKSLPRVVHITSVHTPFDNRIFYKELATLAKAGYDVVLIATHSQDETIEGVRVLSIPKPQNRFERIFRTGSAAVKRAYHEQADVYHIHDPELLIWAQFLRVRGKPIIFDMHENMPKNLLTKSWIHPLLRRPLALIYWLIERILMFNMPVIFAENSYVSDYRWVRSPHVTILNMPIVSNLLEIKEMKYAAPTVGYIGEVNANRGSMTTLEAIHILQKSGYHTEWECVGRLSQAHQTEMETFIQIHQVAGVRIHGYMLPKDGYRLMARCHIGLAVLMPIPNAIQSYPTKMFEYMALGLPIIVSGFPIYRNVVEEAGCGLCLDNPGDPAELAEAIRWLIDHPQEAAEMGQRGRKAVTERYNWDTEAEKLLSFYGGLIQ